MSYDPAVGSWLQQDPAEFDAGDPNLYRYVGNDPTNDTDPTGMADQAMGQQKKLPAAPLKPIVQPGEDFRLFYIFAFEGDTAQYVVRKTGTNGTPSAAAVASSGIKPTGPTVTLHPIEHALNQHMGGPTPYTSASTIPGGAPNIQGEPVWIDVNKLKGNDVFTFKDIMNMSEEFLSRNPVLKQRFEMWKAVQAAEGEILIKGDIGPEAISTQNAMRLKSVARVGGKVLFLAAVAIDTRAFFIAEDKSRELSRITGGWTGAWAGGVIGAAAGANLGAGIAAVAGQAGPQVLTPEEVVTVPTGAVAGGFVGGFVGSIGGYWAGSQAGKNYYDFIKEEVKRWGN